MKRIRFGAADEVPKGTYVELVGSLFATRVPSMIMSGLFAVAGGLVCARTRDPALMLLLIAGIACSIVRIVVVIREGRRLMTAERPAEVAASVERRFASSYLLFAAILGLFGARVFAWPMPALHLLVAILLVGYAAGVAAGTALRPRISIPSLLLATLPGVAVMATSPDPAYRMSAAALLAFLAGGIRSLVERYASQAAKTTRGHASAMLARLDHLTGLPNRLALAERFEDLSATRWSARLAVQCLDLDGFKSVNDRFGHPAGDALLREVADRLGKIVRGDDVVARMGGDEFVFLQTGIKQGHEAAMMAVQLEQRLSEPYQYQGNRIVVGASVGYAVRTHDNMTLEQLIAKADEALLIRKSQRKQSTSEATVVQFGGVRPAM